MTISETLCLQLVGFAVAIFDKASFYSEKCETDNRRIKKKIPEHSPPQESFSNAIVKGNL